MLGITPPKLVHQKRRGRPRKPITPTPKVFRVVFDWNYAEKLSERIAQGLGVEPSVFTYEIAHAALAFGPLRAFKAVAPMKSGCSHRPKIHQAILLRDLARIYSKHIGSTPIAELKKINGYQEERRKDFGDDPLGKRPPVEVLARVVLALWGEEFGESLRRQAREAIKHL